MTVTRFTRFVGIDWSGAKGARQRGIAVAIAEIGRAAPSLVSSSHATGLWSRDEVITWLAAHARGGPSLIGIDFAFGFPPLPVHHMSWSDIDLHCSVDGNLYGGRFFSERDHSYGPYVNGPWGQGPQYSARHHRTTEIEAAKVRGATPSCVLNGVGAAAVGFSSISGMRGLVSLRRKIGPGLAIWPFDLPALGTSTLVEIFPRLFPLLKAQKAAMRSVDHLNATLRAYGSEPFQALVASEDAGDALVSAAALRTLSADARLWGPLPPEARREGWIFGVQPGMAQP